MKMLFAAASAAAIAVAVPAIAQAQVVTPGVYGSVGYAASEVEDLNFGAIQGRLGYRFNDWMGVEGELAKGVKGDEVTVAGPNGPTDVDFDVEWQGAAYAVGFAPLSANTDLFARIGYGKTEIEGSALGQSASDAGKSWNYGVGAQHHFDGVNGVRVDWTRHDFTGDGGKADVWSIGYTRRF